MLELSYDTIVRDTLARFVAYGGGVCTLNTFHPLMSMTSTRTSEDGGLEEYLIVSFDTSDRARDVRDGVQTHTCW